MGLRSLRRQHHEEPQDHLTYGKEVHRVAEEFGRDGTPIPREYGYIEPYVQSLLDMDGEKYFEQDRQ